MNLTEYLSDSIDRIFREAVYSSLTNARESKFLLLAPTANKRLAKKRLQSERDGIPVPPFLIASIATRCNLHCLGCYARSNHACADQAALKELSAVRWGELFVEAKDLGVSFILLAGGEPLERPDVLDEAAKLRRLIFPVFTNGTQLSGKILERFDHHRNLVPVVSIEGDRRQTDGRRGEGTFDLVALAMEEMDRRGIFYGASVTVTKENLNTVSCEDFVTGLKENGCRLVFFVEYVPVDGNIELAPGEEDRRVLAERQDKLRLRYPDMIFLSFPGDEKTMGGCLAAGRGFFHINAFGGAEPCPFSPYSDTSLRTGSLRQALESALFRKIRESDLEAKDHAGGCVLFDRKTEVENILQAKKHTKNLV
jgi:MoaA/NifB/PqqE/SkfB family radical SAM enzyme